MMKEKRTGISRAEAEGRMGIKGKRRGIRGRKQFATAVPHRGAAPGNRNSFCFSRFPSFLFWSFSLSIFGLGRLSKQNGSRDGREEKSLHLAAAFFSLPCRASRIVWRYRECTVVGSTAVSSLLVSYSIRTALWVCV